MSDERDFSDKVLPLGSIPDTTTLPDGIYRLQCDKLEGKLTKAQEGKTQKFMLVATLKVVEPESHKGLPYFENFVIGTDDDPEADELSTWQTSIGGRGIRRFAKATGVPFGDEVPLAEFAANVKDAEVVFTVVQKIDDGKKDERFKGRVSNNTTAMWKLGEQTPGLANGAAAPVKKAGAKTAAGTAAKAAPSDEVSCSACKARVPRKDLKAHVDKHMAELAGSAGNED